MAIAAFQFVAVQNPRLTARLIGQSSGLDATIVLDLEDALWDVDDERRTSDLKTTGRRELVALAADDPGLFARHRIGVRVNRLNGPDAAADIETLAEVSRHATLECVVATKVESGAELAAWAAQLDGIGIAPARLVPIVETVAGLQNLAEVLAMSGQIGLSWIVYGHYDYALDAGWWPFPEIDSVEYRRQALPIISEIEDAGVHFVQAPFFQLSSIDRFGATLAELQRVCRLQPAAITLGRTQTALAAGFEAARGTEPDLLTVAPNQSPSSDEDAIDLARHVVSSYEANRRPTASFAMDARTGEFISPHLYLAALHHLETL